MAQGGWNLFGLGVGISGSGTTVGINAELSPRQMLAYNHLGNFYRPVRTYAGDNKPSAESYELAYVDVPCRFEINQSVDTTSPLGRIEGDQFFTVDAIHVAEQQEIDDNWWVKQVSRRPDGTPTELFGRWWAVRGQPQAFARSERREGGKKLVKASQEKNPPLGIED